LERGTKTMAKESTRISFIIDSGKRYSLDKIAGVYGKSISTVINEANDFYIEIYDRTETLGHLEAHFAEDGDFATDLVTASF
jgi:hypothetical protein